MSYRVDDGRRYGDRGDAGELDRLRAENNRLRAALKRARIDASLEFARAQSNFKRGQELWRERNEARAEARQLRRERDEWKQSYFRMMKKRLVARIGEIQARRWSAAWKRAAKAHRAGRHLAARLFAEWLRRGIEAEDARDEARRWAVQGYRLMRAVERYAAATRWVRAREALRDLVRRYREGRL